jgi:hypothetical protein
MVSHESSLSRGRNVAPVYDRSRIARSRSTVSPRPSGRSQAWETSPVSRVERCRAVLPRNGRAPNAARGSTPPSRTPTSRTTADSAADPVQRYLARRAPEPMPYPEPGCILIPPSSLDGADASAADRRRRTGAEKLGREFGPRKLRWPPSRHSNPHGSSVQRSKAFVDSPEFLGAEAVVRADPGSGDPWPPWIVRGARVRTQPC